MPWYKKAECIASRSSVLPRKENDTLETPPEMWQPGSVSLRIFDALKKLMAYWLCSSMPVAMVRMLGSKMMSLQLNPTSSTRIRYARVQIRTLSSTVAAWPTSSNAMTTTAAPYRLTILACLLNSSSPALSEIELTMHFPCRHCSPCSTTSNFEESTMIGTFATSGSVARRLQKRRMVACESSRPSSKLMSMTCAPFSTCLMAISSILS
mmetsp:Transcript_8266/g.20620  ORF Transcript_8266/g.20620 Transcript_8266/m.20620 type:complete len:209 (+) Transcript_8266:900-1526(+)